MTRRCATRWRDCFAPRSGWPRASCGGRGRAACTGRPKTRSRDHAQLSDELTSALRLLSPSQRAAVFLHYHADLPVSEVAALTGSSVAAVKVQLHRARRALRATLDVGEASGA